MLKDTPESGLIDVDLFNVAWRRFARMEGSKERRNAGLCWCGGAESTLQGLAEAADTQQQGTGG